MERVWRRRRLERMMMVEVLCRVRLRFLWILVCFGVREKSFIMIWIMVLNFEVVRVSKK